MNMMVAAMIELPISESVCGVQVPHGKISWLWLVSSKAPQIANPAIRSHDKRDPPAPITVHLSCQRLW